MMRLGKTKLATHRNILVESTAAIEVARSRRFERRAVEEGGSVFGSDREEEEDEEDEESESESEDEESDVGEDGFDSEYEDGGGPGAELTADAEPGRLSRRDLRVWRNFARVAFWVLPEEDMERRELYKLVWAIMRYV